MPVMLFCVVCGRHFIGKREDNTHNNEIICPFCVEKTEAEVHGESGRQKSWLFQNGEERARSAQAPRGRR
ncbi:hypothetical protein [Kyrpidia tusciae]|uniref:Conserved hypothetical LOC593151 n=1 Tax=Kyrpidia tusciae (strain DSM 2912 / NBRC 15312 / T2) TaxID=562970 RepID=D5WRA4_KYRT2|nr:hypothetical protein [Kyrpidia tusciae]ADG06834.1 conserved hypothetical LOC593151 [Kyrpidia tusciae DSM 2912]